MVIEYDPSRSALYSPEKHETLFQDGVDYSPLQLAIEASRLAYYRWDESATERERLTRALGCAGFGALETFTDAVTTAAGFGTVRAADGTAVLAFRGTQPDNMVAVAHDLQANMTPWKRGGRVHAGFASATNSLRTPITEWIRHAQTASEKLIVTGHSLGAAMATLVASEHPVDWLITLGSPRVGNRDFVQTLQAANVKRLVNCCDAVTEVPLPIGGYTHLGTRTYVSRDSQVLEDPQAAVVDADRRKARLQYLRDYSWKTDRVLVRDLADHAPINYARA